MTIGIRNLVILLFLIFQVIATYGAFIAINESQKIYLYGIISAQALAYTYALSLTLGHSVVSAKNFKQRIAFRLLVFLITFGILVGVVNYLLGRNDGEFFITYSAISFVNIISLSAGFRVGSLNKWEQLKSILILACIFELFQGMFRQLGSPSYVRSSIGLARDGFWPLLYRMKYFFLLVVIAVSYFSLTNGMRIGFVTLTIYVFVAIFLTGDHMKIKWWRVGGALMALVVLVPLTIEFLSSSSRDNLPIGVTVVIDRLERTFSTNANDVLQDGRDDESVAAFNELYDSDLFADILVGRGMGFTFFNPRTGQEASHIHLAVPRLFSRYGILGVLIMFFALAVVVVDTIREVLVDHRVGLLKLAFFHSLVFYMFFGEDVFPSFHFLFGAALAVNLREVKVPSLPRMSQYRRSNRFKQLN